MHKSTHLHKIILHIQVHIHTPHLMSWLPEVQESYRFFHLIRRDHYWFCPSCPDWDVPSQTSFKTHYTHQGTGGLSASTRWEPYLPLSLHPWYLYSDLTRFGTGKPRQTWFIKQLYHIHHYCTTFSTVQVQVCCPKPLIHACVLCSDPWVISRATSFASARPLLIACVVWETREPSACDQSTGACLKSIKSFLFATY